MKMFDPTLFVSLPDQEMAVLRDRGLSDGQIERLFDAVKDVELAFFAVTTAYYARIVLRDTATAVRELTALRDEQPTARDASAWFFDNSMKVVFNEDATVTLTLDAIITLLADEYADILDALNR
jgi:DNA-binding transcriptional regulator LsrR (DeoR family)